MSYSVLFAELPQESGCNVWLEASRHQDLALGQITNYEIYYRIWELDMTIFITKHFLIFHAAWRISLLLWKTRIVFIVVFLLVYAYMHVFGIIPFLSFILPGWHLYQMNTVVTVLESDLPPSCVMFSHKPYALLGFTVGCFQGRNASSGIRGPCSHMSGELLGHFKSMEIMSLHFDDHRFQDTMSHIIIVLNYLLNIVQGHLKVLRILWRVIHERASCVGVIIMNTWI